VDQTTSRELGTLPATVTRLQGETVNSSGELLVFGDPAGRNVPLESDRQATGNAHGVWHGPASRRTFQASRGLWWFASQIHACICL